MSTMVWSPRLQLDLPEIDAAHKGLIALMGKLHEQSAARAAKPEVLRTFQALATATRAHFTDEERFMQGIGYADLDKHALIHARLLQELDQHFHAFKTSPSAQVPEAVFEFLRVWLQAHIAGIDRKYAEFAHAGHAHAGRGGVSR